VDGGRRKQMLPYQKDGKKLEELLDSLFGDNDESTPEDVTVTKKPIRPPVILTSCCTYNYTSL
jgi:hypothetical protein